MKYIKRTKYLNLQIDGKSISTIRIADALWTQQEEGQFSVNDFILELNKFLDNIKLSKTGTLQPQESLQEIKNKYPIGIVGPGLCR